MHDGENHKKVIIMNNEQRTSVCCKYPPSHLKSGATTGVISYHTRYSLVFQLFISTDLQDHYVKIQDDDDIQQDIKIHQSMLLCVQQYLHRTVLPYYYMGP